MKATYKKEYIKKKCLEKISSLEKEYSKIDFVEEERLSHDMMNLAEKNAKAMNEEYDKNMAKYMTSYAKAAADKEKERQDHYAARKDGHDPGPFISCSVYPTWTPTSTRGASIMMGIEIENMSARKTIISDKADIINSKLEKLERILTVCEDDMLSELQLSDYEISLIFC